MMPQNDQKPPTLLDWLGLRRPFEFTVARPLGGFVGFLVGLVAVVLFVGFLLTLFDFIRAALRLGPFVEDTTGEGIRNTGLVLVALLGGPFLVWRSYVAAKQANTQVEALFNDKINAAATDLAARRQVTRVVGDEGNLAVLTEWEDDVVTRLVAIGRLEELARQNLDAHLLITEMLCAYIRAKTPIDPETDEPEQGQTLEDWIDNYPRLRVDVQAALDVVSRRNEHQIAFERKNGYRVNLSGTNLRRCTLMNANLCNAELVAVRFDGAFIDGTRFEDSDLENARFRRAWAPNCDFSRSILRKAVLIEGRFSGAVFDNSDMFQVKARSAQLLGNPSVKAGRASFKGANLADASFVQSRNVFGYEFLHEFGVLQAEEEEIFERAFTSEQTVLLEQSVVKSPSFNFENLRWQPSLEYHVGLVWRRWRKESGLE